MSNSTYIPDIDAFFAKHDYGLNEYQQKTIKKRFKEDESIINIAREVYDDPTIVARSKEYNSVRNFLEKVKRDAPPVHLDKDAQEYIRNNAHLMRPIDLAKAIFKDAKLKPLSNEVKTVDKFVKILGLNFSMGSSDLQDYSIPKANSKLISKINEADPSANFKEDTLSSAQEKQVNNLRSFLSNSRFLSHINSIEDQTERDLFENEFVASTYKKLEMNAEDLQTCVSLAYHYVLEKRIQDHLIILDTEIMSAVEGGDVQLKMTLTDAYGKKADELDKCVKRIQSLQRSLSTNYSQRLDAQTAANKSVLSLVEVWKEEDTRKKLLLAAKATDAAVDSTMDELEDESSLIASIFGISKEEIRDGKL